VKTATTQEGAFPGFATNGSHDASAAREWLDMQNHAAANGMRGLDFNAQNRAAVEMYSKLMSGMPQQQQKEGALNGGNTSSVGAGASKDGAGSEADKMSRVKSPIMRVVEENRNMHAAAAAAAAAAHQSTGGRQPPPTQFPGLVSGLPSAPGLGQALKPPSPYDKLHAHETKLE